AASPSSTDNTSVQTISVRSPISEEQIRQAVARLEDARAPLFRRIGAMRDLAATTDPAAVAGLQALARDRSAPEALRCEAILALTGTHHDHVSGLRSLLEDPVEDVAVETARALRPWIAADGVRTALESVAASGRPRLMAMAGWVLGRPAQRPSSFDEWRQFVEAEPGDAARGFRVFRSAEAGCLRCHQVFGRGGALGPDLSAIRRGSDRPKLLRSLLEPSRDIAPQFADHQVETTAGDLYSGRLVSTEPDGSITVMNGDGQLTRIPGPQVKSNVPGTVSLMPEGLVDALTPGDVRDLMAYLETLR
ncbi:MAG: c-type cytochrome, partial [Verrucomicrobiae bacterium]|nr:c-type cytochrome [Verrucomicrobiae bacterium]